MGFVDAFRTFMDVFKDDKLGPIQKFVSVIVGFIGGVGSLASETIKAIESILAFIPGGGWINKHLLDPVAKALDTHDLGKNTAQAFREYNELGNAPANDAYKSGEKYKNASPEEKKRMDAQHEQLEHKGMHFMPQGKGGKGIWVPDTKASPAPAPVTPVLPPQTPPPKKESQEVHVAIKEQTKSNKEIAENLKNLSKAILEKSNSQISLVKPSKVGEKRKRVASTPE